MITLDTSAILALLIADDANHRDALAILSGERRPFLVPEGIMAEVCFMLEREYGTPGLRAFLEDIVGGGFTLESSRPDTTRILELVMRYQNLPLGYANAAVIACAEHHNRRILALDEHFVIVSREGSVTVVSNPGE